MRFTCDDFKFWDTGSHLSVIGYMGDYRDIEIPSHVNGRPVTVISEGAFNRKELNSVYIPDTVSVIGVSAFQHSNLFKVNIPDSVTEIKDSAFRDNNLTEVDIGCNVFRIRDNAFLNNNLTSIVIPDSNSDRRKFF